MKSNEDKKKWLVILRKEQWNWIKDTAEEVGLKGSDIIREIIDERMRDNPRNFKSKLAQTHLRIKLQRLDDKQLAIEAERKEIEKRLKEDTREKVLA